MIAASLASSVMLVMTLINLRVYRVSRRDAAPPPPPGDGGPLVSVCIPARNEEANLEAIVRSVLASDLAHGAVEVLVYDDHSRDATPEILDRLIAEDARVKRVATRPLPAGWVGKQHACDCLGRAASGAWLLFTDADVRFEPDCLRRATAEAQRMGVSLLSTFPRQLTGTVWERLIVPMIHFILFSYLPMPRMRRTNDPSASAGCGQFLLAERGAYLATGGHSAFADSMHDGIRMPRTFRKAGYRTDLFDGTDVCACRMYRGLGATWRGFAKNAYEGLGSVGLLVFLTVVHGLTAVAPLVYLAGAWGLDAWERGATAPAVVAAVIPLVQRAVLARRFGQSWLGAALHPVGVVLMTAIQWHSFALHAAGRRSWRGRVQGDAPAVGQAA